MADFSSLLGQLTIGLETAFTLHNLLFCASGIILGMIVGVLPGIGALAAISMLFPITFHVEPASAIILLAGIYYGSAYGGSITSILLNVAGDASSAVTCLDGNPMARQGRAGVALFMTTVASFCAACFGILIMMFFAPLIARIAITFQAPEYFAVMALGLTAASTISVGSPIKGFAMVILGIMFGLVGMDVYSGVSRFSFGQLTLFDGISLVAVAMGLFGVAEVISSVRSTGTPTVQKVTLRSMIPTKDDIKRSVFPILRGASIGSFFGTLPGTGGTIASFMSYAVEKRVSREPQRFGTGAIEGVVAPEASNNAADQTAFIPTLALGIPGTASMAIILGVFIIHGINPGPRLMTQHPDIFWGLVMSFWIGNVLLLVLNIPLIGLWVRLLQIPYYLLYPAIVVFICIGVYSVNNNVFDIWMVILFGVLGYAMRLFELPAPPFLLGFILGPMLEDHFRRAMIVARGDFGVFFHRPISAVVLTIALGLIAWGIYSSVSRRGAETRAVSDAS